MDGHGWAWVGIDQCWLVMVWVWVQIRRKILGSDTDTITYAHLGLPKPIMMDMACWWASYCCCCLSQVAGVQVSRCYTPHHFCQPPSRRLATTVSASSYLIHPLLCSPLPPLSRTQLPSNNLPYLTWSWRRRSRSRRFPLCSATASLTFPFNAPHLGPFPSPTNPASHLCPFLPSKAAPSTSPSLACHFSHPASISSHMQNFISKTHSCSLPHVMNDVQAIERN